MLCSDVRLWLLVFAALCLRWCALIVVVRCFVWSDMFVRFVLLCYACWLGVVLYEMLGYVMCLFVLLCVVMVRLCCVVLLFDVRCVVCVAAVMFCGVLLCFVLF